MHSIPTCDGDDILESIVYFSQLLRHPLQLVLLMLHSPFGSTQHESVFSSSSVIWKLRILLQRLNERQRNMLEIKLKEEIYTGSIIQVNAKVGEFVQELHHQCAQRSIPLNNVPVSEPSTVLSPPLLPLKSPFVPYSESIVWKRQQSFYSERSLDAFEHVPSRISSNAHVSNLYLQQIDGIANNISIKQGKPLEDVSICILEIGAGHCILSYLLSRGTSERAYATLTIATDFHTTIMSQLLTLPWIQELCMKGILDFASLGTLSKKSNPNELYLLHSQRTLKQQRPPGGFDAVVMVANYAFDSLPIDIYISEKNRWFQIGYQPYDCALSAVTTDRKKMRPRKFTYSYKEIHSHDIPKIIANASDGAYVYPKGGILLLKTIKGLFECNSDHEVYQNPQYCLLVGDCYHDADDQEWSRGGSYDMLLRTTCMETAYAFPSFDPPLISPLPQALAVPPNIDTLFDSFRAVFVEKQYLDHQKRRYVNVEASCSAITPVINSGFSVYKIITKQESSIPCKRKITQICAADDKEEKDEEEEEEEEEEEILFFKSQRLERRVGLKRRSLERSSISYTGKKLLTNSTKTSIKPSKNIWGPLEFIQMCEILTEQSISNKVKKDPICANHYQHLAYCALTVLSDYDLKLLVDIRWSLCLAVQCNSVGYRWGRVATNALRHHYSLSTEELSKDTLHIIQWLLRMKDASCIYTLRILCTRFLLSDSNDFILHGSLDHCQKAYIGYYLSVAERRSSEVMKNNDDKYDVNRDDLIRSFEVSIKATTTALDKDGFSESGVRLDKKIQKKMRKIKRKLEVHLSEFIH